MKYRKHSDEFKEQVVKEYLSGARHKDIILKYKIRRGILSKWVRKWKDYGTFPDGRGKKSTGRPKTIKRADMTDQEYIEYLEMQLEIKKYMAFYEKRKQN